MANWRQRWLNYWFCPVEADNLAFCRILFFGTFSLFFLFRDFRLWGDVAPVFWMPISIFKLLSLPLLSANTIGILQIIWKSSLLLSCLGLFTRINTSIAFFFGLYLIGLPHNFGKINHNDALVVIVLAIFALSRCGDARSLDCLIINRGKANPKVIASGEYCWPIRTVWLMFALIYFAAGVTKLKLSGWNWIFSDNFSQLLIEPSYNLTTRSIFRIWSLKLSQFDWLCRIMAGITIILEVGYPLVLFNRHLRWIFVPAMIVAHVGIQILMGPVFHQLIICNLFWIDWQWLWQQVKAYRVRKENHQEHEGHKVKNI